MVILFCLLISCRHANQRDSPEELTKILTGYFEGIENGDFDKMRSLTTNDFIIYEDGLIWNNDSIISFIKSFPGSVKINYVFDDFKINIDNNSGSVFYLNHADMVINDTMKMSFDWIESATFIKAENSWKMNFLHSTARK